MQSKLRNVFVGCALAVGTVAVTYWASTVDLDSIRSRALEFLSDRKPVLAERQAFRNTPFFVLPPGKNHSHGEAAADRTAANSFMDAYFQSLNLTPFHVQMSSKDQLESREGSRVFFWSKDLAARHVSAPHTIPRTSGICLTDVDYYLDMNDFLTRRGANGKPVLIYTVVPEKVADNKDGVAFTFTEKGTFRMVVSGGAVYEHQLWDYTHDVILAVRRWFGIPISATAFVIERRTTSIPHHALLCLVPIRTFGILGAWLSMTLGCDKLQRLDPRVKGTKYLRMDVLSKDGLTRSTGIAGQYAEVSVPAHVDDGVSNMSVASSIVIPVATVQGYTGIEDKGGASILAQYHRDKVKAEAPMVAKVNSAVNHYQYASAGGFDEDPKPGCVAYMPPIVAGAAYSPMVCKGNDEQAVRGRIVSIASSAKMTPQLSTWMDEFLGHFVTRPGELDFSDIDEVFERQDRPSQRRILHEADLKDPKRMISAFMKREVYPEVKDPRPISTINSVDKRDYSMVTYALYPIFKDSNWYAFGLTPLEIADRVALLCSRQGVASVVETDLSRFDGRVSEVLRTLERRLLSRAFKAKLVDIALHLHSAQYGLLGRFSSGVVYDTGNARCSGSPETALFNSLANAFMAYCTYRESGLGSATAYNSLGIYGGDDGVSPNVEPAICEKVCLTVGQVIKAKKVIRGQPVTFLARVFGPGVWYGDNNSCCDILRQITKLHVTTSLDVPPKVKFIEKMYSYFLTDPGTPIFGSIHAWMIFYGHYPLTEESVASYRTGRDTTWFGQFHYSVQFPNHHDEWMFKIVHDAMPTFDWRKLVEYTTTEQTLEEFVANMPTCYEFPPMVVPPEVLVNGDNLDAFPKTPEELPAPEAKQPSNVGNEPSPMVVPPVAEVVAKAPSKPAGKHKAKPKVAGHDKQLSKNSRRKEARHAKPKQAEARKAKPEAGAKL